MTRGVNLPEEEVEWRKLLVSLLGLACKSPSGAEHVKKTKAAARELAPNDIKEQIDALPQKISMGTTGPWKAQVYKLLYPDKEIPRVWSKGAKPLPAVKVKQEICDSEARVGASESKAVESCSSSSQGSAKATVKSEGEVMSPARSAPTNAQGTPRKVHVRKSVEACLQTPHKAAKGVSAKAKRSSSSSSSSSSDSSSSTICARSNSPSRDQAVSAGSAPRGGHGTHSKVQVTQRYASCVHTPQKGKTQGSALTSVSGTESETLRSPDSACIFDEPAVESPPKRRRMADAVHQAARVTEAVKRLVSGLTESVTHPGKFYFIDARGNTHWV
mmetsp:Transcript_150710/g.281043  ORF Transcript_150710/g.281043 Transcript_150710/m.281043 type:complete len:330 (+) Transcript_150710:47-1036(+)